MYRYLASKNLKKTMEGFKTREDRYHFHVHALDKPLTFRRHIDKTYLKSL